MARKPPKVHTTIDFDDEKITLNRHKKEPQVRAGVCSVDDEIDFKPIRMQGTKEQWRNLLERMDNAGLLPIELILEMAYDNEAREVIQSSYYSDPSTTSFEIHQNFLMPALCKLQHGNISKSITPSEGKEIIFNARWVYAFVCYWIKKPVAQWPVELRDYECTKKKENTVDALSFTAAILTEYYGEEFELSEAYNNHIARGNHLGTIKKALSDIKYLPTHPPLSEIFRTE